MRSDSYRISLITIAFLLSLVVIPASAQKKGNNTHRLKVGLVLGGGGAKGAAEVGVLKTIEKVGIPIDYIAGTSIGSIVGGLYSYGYRANALDSLFRSQKWVKLMVDIKPSPKGMLKGMRIVKLFEDLTHMSDSDSISFDKLPIPFRCVAVDIRKDKEVVLASGNLPIAMRASMSIPYVFKPVEIDSMLLVDGGMLNNLPVDVVRKMGADVVIAIDLTQNKSEKIFRKLKKRKGIGRLIQWIKKRPDLEKYNINRKDCDVYINPDLTGFNAMSFTSSKVSKMIEIGEKAGKKAESKLKALKSRLYKRR